jgi:hypothetical protein
MGKRMIFFSSILLGVNFLCAGCAKDAEEDTSLNLQPLSEIREEAADFQKDYTNLNLDGTTIIIPEVEEIHDLTFPISTDSYERQIEKFEENIRKYEGLDEDVDLAPYMTMMYWDKIKNDRLEVPFNEMTDELLEQIQYLSYNDGTCSELLIFSDYMLEMGNYEIPQSLLGDTTDYSDKPYGYRGVDLGTLVETYYLPDDDISGVVYHLEDGDLSLPDAVEYVEKHMKEDYYFVGSELLDYHVFEIEVRQLSEDIYYYQFRVGTSYDGIILNWDSSLGGITGANANASTDVAEDGEGETDTVAPKPFGTAHRTSMFRSDQLGFIWGSCHSFESVELQETHTDFITVEEACDLLSQNLSNSHCFSVKTITLEYQTEFTYENKESARWGYVQSVYCHPVYHFVIANPQIAGYAKIYFNVDALTGEILTMRESE